MKTLIALIGLGISLIANAKDGKFSAERNNKAKLDGGETYSLKARRDDSRLPQIVQVDIARNAGSAPYSMWVKLPGKEFDIFGVNSIGSIEKEFHKNQSAVLFLEKLAAPLIPIQNRLVGKEVGPNLIETEVLGVKVKARVNFGLQPGQKPLHIHGMTYDKKPTFVEHRSDVDRAELRGVFDSGYYQNEWTGQASLEINQTLFRNRFEYRMKFKNTGTTKIPVGGGAHPYIYAPSGNFKSIRLHIPAKKIAVIDNYSNVLPTGELKSVSLVKNLDFNEKSGRALDGQYIDNFWTDLDLNSDGFAFAEFFDAQSNLKIVITALNKNVIGIQAYAPKESRFVAIELVTHLPDPRESLWKLIPTGMVLLEPGETFEYGYKVEVLPIKPQS